MEAHLAWEEVWEAHPWAADPRLAWVRTAAHLWDGETHERIASPAAIPAAVTLAPRELEVLAVAAADSLPAFRLTSQARILTRLSSSCKY